MKEHEPIEFPMLLVLTQWLDRYIEVYRPLLLRGRQLGRLSISIRSTPMPANSIYCRIVETTTRLVGHGLNPHGFRDCVATFIAEQAPEEVRIIARILGHTTFWSPSGESCSP